MVNYYSSTAWTEDNDQLFTTLEIAPKQPDISLRLKLDLSFQAASIVFWYDSKC